MSLRRGVLPTFLLAGLALLPASSTLAEDNDRPTHGAHVVAASAEAPAAPVAVDPISKVKVHIEAAHDVEAEAIRHAAAAANRGQINLILYGRNQALLQQTGRAMQEAIYAGKPIGTLFLARETENLDGTGPQRNGVAVYFEGQELNERLAVNKSEVLDLIDYAEELRNQRAQTPDTGNDGQIAFVPN